MSDDTPAALAPEEEAAAMLYSVYRLQVGGVNEAGLAMPGWSDLSIPLHNAWMAVADAATGGSPSAPEVPAPPPLWTQEDLEQLTVTDLRELCTQSGLSVPGSALKQDLIDALLASQGGTS